MKIRIESSSASSQNPTGVGYYTRRLSESLKHVSDLEIIESQFNFRGRQKYVREDVETINFPQKIYAKLDYLRIAPPFDLTLTPVDVTLFPNYALWPTIRSKKRIVTIHDLSFLKFPEVVESKNLAYLQRIVPHAVHNADLVLTVSETVRQEIVDHFKISADKVHVTPVPPTETYSVTSDRPVRETYNIPTQKYILFASTIEPRKNLEVVLDAYSLLPSAIRKTHSLVVAGGMGWKSEAVKAKLDALKSKEPNVVVTGYYDQLDAAALFQQADVFVMPSFYEGFGMPLLEAMAGKTPTIASDIPVFQEVCGDASLYFDANDADALSAQLQLLLEDPKLQAKYIEKGLKNLERYSWDTVATSLYKKLQKL